MNRSQSIIVRLKPRTRSMFQYLLETGECIPTKTLAARYGLNERTIRYDLEEIEFACRFLPVNMIRDSRRGVTIEATVPEKEQVLKWLQDPEGSSEIWDAQERLYRLLSVLLTAEEPVVVKQLEHVLNVSPRTIYADMDKAETWLNNVGLQLIRKPHYGVKIEGSEFLRRYACFIILNKYLSEFKDEVVYSQVESQSVSFKKDYLNLFLFDTFINREDFSKMISIVTSFATELSLRQRLELSLYLSIALKRISLGHSVVLAKQNVKLLQEAWEYQAAECLIGHLQQEFGTVISEEETACVALHYVGAWRFNHFQPSPIEKGITDPFINQIVEHMLAAVDNALGTVLRADEDLFNGLVIHVKPMVYRVIFGIPMQNDLLEEIKTDYALAYQAAVVAGQCIETLLTKTVSSAEIGYIALHFGAALERRKRQLTKNHLSIRVAVVCPGGLGTSKILASRLEAKLPGVIVVWQLNTIQAQFMQMADTIDGIVSTIPLPHTTVPNIVVNPLLPTADLERVNQWTNKLLLTRRKSAVIKDLASLTQQLFKIHHLEINNADLLYLEVDQMVNRLALYSGEESSSEGSWVASSDQTYDSRKGGPAMLDLLMQNSIKVKFPAKNREEVIEEAGSLLVQSGAVEPRYVEAMKNSIVENGPYMVIVPGVAILHARPEDGVREVCMSLLTLEKGISFGHKDNDPVYLAIAFGAVDQYRHIEALSDLMKLLTDNQAVADIIAAESVQQVKQILNRILRETGQSRS